MGHIRAARAFLDTYAPDILYILPTAVPPHKSVAADENPVNRLEMSRLAFENLDPRISVSDYEQTRGGKSYTILTLEHFRETADDICLLCGTDMFLTLDTWFRGEDILRMAKICCLLREDDPTAADRIRQKADFYRAAFGTEIIFPQFTPLPISSTVLRDMVKNGQSTQGYVTDPVRIYIDEHKLYV